MTRQDDANIYIKRFLDQVKGASEEDVAFALSNLIVSVGMIVAMIGLPPVPRLFPEEKGSSGGEREQRRRVYEVCEESCG